MANFEKGPQTPVESTLRGPTCGVENGVPNITADIAYGAKAPSAEDVSNGNEACCNDQENQVPDARQWNLKYKLFVSFSAICSYFVM
jgi:hypothetical protein